MDLPLGDAVCCILHCSPLLVGQSALRDGPLTRKFLHSFISPQNEIAKKQNKQRSAGEEPGLCVAVVAFLEYTFLVIFVGPIISTSTGPICTKIAGPVDLWP